MAQVSIRFAAPGTRNYTVGNDVVGGVMKMEAIGAGGAGGTATVNSGGGGKGGAYARRNAQAVTAGQTLTVTVAPSAAAAAGAASSVSVAGGQVTFGVPARTITLSQTFNNGLQWASILLEATTGVPSFVGATASETATGSPNPQTIPAHNDGDLGIFVIASTSTASNQEVAEGNRASIESQGWIPIASGTLLDIWYKLLTQSDTQTPTLTGATNYDTYCLVYRNTNAPTIAASDLTSSTSRNTFTTSAFSKGTNFLMVYAFGGGTSTAGGANTAAAQPTYPTGVNPRVSAASYNSVFAYAYGAYGADEAATQSASSATTYVQAAGGNVGGNGSATAGGAGGTAQNGTSTGDVTFTGGNGGTGTLTAGGAGGGGAGDASNTTGAGPNTQFGVSRGQGGASAAAGQVYGGGGGGATTLAARGAGASGIVVLTYSTGTGTISHTAMFNRRITAFRRVVASITHSSVFNRLVTIRRMFTASVTHVSRALKTIKLRKTASITHLAAYTRKALRLRKTASIVHTPFIRRALRVLRTASIVHTPVFQRLVTLRRRFVASVQHRARMLVKLEARLIPRNGGGGVTNVFRNLFLFDD